jgi:hypothetical protein
MGGRGVACPQGLRPYHDSPLLEDFLAEAGEDELDADERGAVVLVDN